MRVGHREKVAISNRLPRFWIRAYSALVRFEIERSGISFLLPLLFEEGLPFLNSFKIDEFCVAGKNFLFCKFEEGAARCLKCFWARLLVFRAEKANQRFSTSAPTGPWKRALGII